MPDSNTFHQFRIGPEGASIDGVAVPFVNGLPNTFVGITINDISGASRVSMVDENGDVGGIYPMGLADTCFFTVHCRGRGGRARTDFSVRGVAAPQVQRKDREP